MSASRFEDSSFPLVAGTAFNHYNQRQTEDGVVSGGEVEAFGVEFEAVVYVRGTDFAGGTSFDTLLVLPQGAKFNSAYVEIEEAFVLGGTTPTIAVGTKGSETTNNAIELTEAQAEATSPVVNETGAGTFANFLAADTAISVALGGATPTVTDAGALKVVVRYTKT